MSNEESRFSSKQETGQQLHPREQLELFLKEQEFGSPRVQAIADKVALYIVENRIRQKLSEFNSPSSTAPEPEQTRDHLFLADLMDAAAIRETIRRRSFGTNATEYTTSLYKASNMLDDYNKHFYKQAQKGDNPVNVDENRMTAASMLLSDLQRINNNNGIKAK